MTSFSIYLHIPFCQRRCGYCDFNTYAGIEHLIGPYVDAVCAEIQGLSAASEMAEYDEIGTIYFGGGTPSLLRPEMIGNILDQVKFLGNFTKNVEISMEVNPGTVDFAYLESVREQGVNRLSIGVQSANPDELKLLDRLHGFTEAERVVAEARRAGFNNLSMDLIYGLPGQKMASWAHSLDAVLSLSPEHLSMYALTIEPGTPLEHQVKTGVVPLPDDDRTADMYEYVCGVLRDRDFAHYEISNWAKITKDGSILLSQHNRQYWLNQPYLGVGAGAHGFISSTRTVNEFLPEKYIRKLKENKRMPFPQTSATTEVTGIESYREKQETLLMGLRLLLEGVPDSRFRARFGESYWDVFSKEFDRLMEKGLIRVEKDGDGGDVLKLSEDGVFVSNLVFQEFV